MLAANRDELHARPSAALARWDGEDAHIIAGRDLLSGGTWLGISEQGRVGVVTNIRSDIPPDLNKASRGALVANYLRGVGLPALAELDGYNAFSLLTFGPEGATLSANRQEPMVERLEPGVHGLSNGAPGEDWPRKDRLLAAFSGCLAHENDLPEALLTLLASESIDDTIFIRNPVYGTRCSTVVLVDRDGTGTVLEQRFDADGGPNGRTLVRFV